MLEGFPREVYRAYLGAFCAFGFACARCRCRGQSLRPPELLIAIVLPNHRVWTVVWLPDG